MKKKSHLKKKIVLGITGFFTVISLLSLIMNLIHSNSGLFMSLICFVCLLCIFIYCFKLLNNDIAIEKFQKSIANLTFRKEYGSEEDIKAAFEFQKKHPIYMDDKFTLTDEFLYSAYHGDKIFIIEGIVYAASYSYMVDNVMEKMGMKIFYMDGKGYSFDYDKKDKLTSELYEKLEQISKTILNKSGKFIMPPPNWIW